MDRMRVMTFNIRAAFISAEIDGVNIWQNRAGLNVATIFLHFNTHLDHVSELARAEGAKLILREAHRLRSDGIPVMITGGFNCNPGSPVHRLFLESGFADTYLAAGHEDTEASHTFHAFEGERYSAADHSMAGRIDWIMTRDGTKTIRTQACFIARDEEPPLYPSDH